MKIPKFIDWEKLYESTSSGNRPGYYSWGNLSSIYRKLKNGTWQVKTKGSSNFIDLVKGDINTREENLDAAATPIKLNLLFVGDSNTASVAGGKFYGWWIQQKLGANNVSITSLAKHGMGTNWMISNLQSHLASKPKGFYNIITILGGSNDVWNGTDKPAEANAVSANIQALESMASAHGARVIIISPPSKRFQPDVISKESLAIKRLGILSKVVDWEKNTYGDRFINFNWMTSPEGGATEADFESDKRHLKPNKHEELANMWISRVYWGVGPEGEA